MFDIPCSLFDILLIPPIKLPLYIPRHSSRHSLLLPALLSLLPRTIKIVRESQQEVTLEHHGTGVFNILCTYIPPDTLILIQKVIDRKLNLAIFLLEDLQGNAAIP